MKKKKNNIKNNVFFRNIVFQSFRNHIFSLFSNYTFKEKIENGIRILFYSFCYMQNHINDFPNVPNNIFPSNRIRYTFRVDILKVEINDEKNLQLGKNSYFGIQNVLCLYELAITFRISIKSNIISKSIDLTYLASSIVLDSVLNGKALPKNTEIKIKNSAHMIKFVTNLRNRNSNIEKVRYDCNEIVVIDDYFLDGMRLVDRDKNSDTGLLNKLKIVSDLQINNGLNRKSALKIYDSLINSSFERQSVNVANYRGNFINNEHGLYKIIYDELGISDLDYREFFLSIFDTFAVDMII